MNEEARKEEIVQNLLNPSKKALQINKNVRRLALFNFFRQKIFAKNESAVDFSRIL